MERRQLARSVGMRLGAVLCGLAAGLLLAELTVRMFMPPQSVRFVDAQPHQFTDPSFPRSLNLETLNGPRNRPNTTVTIEHHMLHGQPRTVRTNELGFRGAHLGAKRPGEFRILMLGDSIAFADYAVEEETIEAYLQERLRPGAPGLLVINGGKPASDLLTQYHILLESGIRAEPDLIVFLSYLNDSTRLPYLVPLTGPLSNSALAVKVYEAVNRMRIVDAERKKFAAEEQNPPPAFWRLDGDWKTNPDTFDAIRRSAVIDWGSAWSDAAWNEMSPIYADIQRAAAAQHVPLAVILTPVMYQVAARFNDDVPQQRFEAVMKRLGIPHFDLLPPLRREAQTRPGAWFYDHCHYTPLGNRLVAGFIADFLLAQHLVPQEGVAAPQ